jgi:Cu-Zn family superoxide dismutase
MRPFSVLIAAGAVSVFTLACSQPEAPAESEAAAQAPAPASTGNERYELPAEVTFPEGIAHDATRGAVYTASAADGLVARLNLTSRETTVVTPAGVLMPAGSTTFPGPLGMELDSQDRLWIAGGRLGRMFVVDVATGSVLKQLEVPTPQDSLINDVAIVGSAAYFTDTRSPTLWRVEASGDQIGELEPWLSFDGTPLEYGTGANLNGIAATPDGQTLIVVHMGEGLLFRIDLGTKAVSAIDTSGAELSGADGLVLDGRTLYVVRQTAVEIATVELADDLSSGTVTSRFTDPMLAWPATAVKVGDRLLVVNTQFNTRQDETTTLPFTILSVPVARLGQ